MIFIVLLLFFPLFGEGAQFEELVNRSPGVLDLFPQEIRDQRVGPVGQEVHISDSGLMTITLSFSYRHRDTKKIITAHAVKQFSLTAVTYECNPHLHTITFSEDTEKWKIAFGSHEAYMEAVALLLKLVQGAQEVCEQKLSEIAREKGFSYLIVAPRVFEKQPFSAQSTICWLTKAQSLENLRDEAKNMMPLFIYDLEAINRLSFFTTSTFGSRIFMPCTSSCKVIQSARASDSYGFANFLQHTPFAGLVCENDVDLGAPRKIICSSDQKAQMSKLGSCHVFEPLFAQTNESMLSFPWFQGVNSNSIDVFRYAFFHSSLNKSFFQNILNCEFPRLADLFTKKCPYQKKVSIQDHCVQLMEKSKGEPKYLQVVLFTYELGSIFGSKKQIAYNSLPFALAVAEMVGLNSQEKRIVKALLESLNVKKNSPFSLLFVESRYANDASLSMHDWLKLKQKFLALAFPSIKKQKQLQRLEKEYPLLLSLAIPRGRIDFPEVHSYTVWEERDLHGRSARLLNTYRAQYEQLVVEKKQNKDSFWEWLENG